MPILTDRLKSLQPVSWAFRITANSLAPPSPASCKLLLQAVCSGRYQEESLSLLWTCWHCRYVQLFDYDYHIFSPSTGVTSQERTMVTYALCIFALVTCHNSRILTPALFFIYSTPQLHYYCVTWSIIAFYVVTEYGPGTPDPFPRWSSGHAHQHGEKASGSRNYGLWWVQLQWFHLWFGVVD